MKENESKSKWWLEVEFLIECWYSVLSYWTALKSLKPMIEYIGAKHIFKAVALKKTWCCKLGR